MLGVRIKQARCTCFTTQMNPKAVWSRRLRNMQVSMCWWSVNCCVLAWKQTQRDTQGRKRAKCAHVGGTNNKRWHQQFHCRRCRNSQKKRWRSARRTKKSPLEVYHHGTRCALDHVSPAEVQDSHFIWIMVTEQVWDVFRHPRVRSVRRHR